MELLAIMEETQRLGGGGIDSEPNAGVQRNRWAVFHNDLVGLDVESLPEFVGRSLA